MGVEGMGRQTCVPPPRLSQPGDMRIFFSLLLAGSSHHECKLCRDNRGRPRHLQRGGLLTVWPTQSRAPEAPERRACYLAGELDFSRTNGNRGRRRSRLGILGVGRCVISTVSHLVPYRLLLWMVMDQCLSMEGLRRSSESLETELRQENQRRQTARSP